MITVIIFGVHCIDRLFAARVCALPPPRSTHRILAKTNSIRKFVTPWMSMYSSHFIFLY
jgi:hypothetical protein